MSLRARVAALVVGAFTLVLLVVGVLVPTLVHGFLIEQLDRDLADSAFAALPMLRAELSGFDAPGSDDHERGESSATYTNIYAAVRDDDGQTIVDAFGESAAAAGLSAPDLPDQIDGNREAFTVGSAGDQPSNWRVMVTELQITTGDGPPATGQLIVALPTSSVDDTISRIVRIELVAGGVSLVVLALAGWWLVALGLRPLGEMERAAAAISDAGDLGQRVGHPGERTELGRLGVTLNAMLSRLQSSFEAQQTTERKLRRFVADASHELRTPLTSIRGYAELYRRGGNGPEQVGRSMERIENEALRMGGLVDDLLALARLDDGGELEHTPVDLARVVGDLVDDARVVASDRTIGWSGPVECVVNGDGHRLTQAIANLLSNARLHTPPGTAIEVGLTRTARSARLEVVDHGLGLPNGAASQVFDRFYRADPSRSRLHGGSGLGLAITAAIVAAHGGTVAATPTVGGGATFTIDLPAD